MKTPSTPAPPDPVATAAAQAGANRDTAVTQGLMNMINQRGPDGSLTYNQIGEQTLTDSLTGKSYTIPRYEAVTELSPAQQQLQSINDQTQQNIATIGRDQSARIGALLGKPIDLSNEATEARLMDLGSKRLDPRFAREEEALRTRLVNQGIRPGTAAFDAEMSNFSQGRNDAYNNLLLTGRGQAVQEALAERNQPINEISALLSGSQVSQPNFVNTPQTQVAGTDYAGIVNSNYQAQVAAANQKAQSGNAMMGGLFGLAGTLGKVALPMISDRRAKTEISPVGRLNNGLKVYRYRYKAGGPFMIGLMADEVAEVHPEAIERLPNGLDAVHYDLAVQ